MVSVLFISQFTINNYLITFCRVMALNQIILIIKGYAYNA
jgi:hypothetical protein